MNLGLLLFIIVNILRQINLLIMNWKVLNIVDIYNNTLKSFSYFAMLTLPCIIILSIYSIITNIILIKKEGFHPRRLLGIILGFFAIFGLCGSQTLYFVISKLLINTDKQFIKFTLDVCINATLSYLYTLIIATLYCNIKAANHIPKYDKDFVIILGSRINKDICDALIEHDNEIFSVTHLYTFSSAYLNNDKAMLIKKSYSFIIITVVVVLLTSILTIVGGVIMENELKNNIEKIEKELKITNSIDTQNTEKPKMEESVPLMHYLTEKDLKDIIESMD